MFNYLPLLIVFGFLAVFDLLDSKRINILFILIGAFVLFFMNNFTLLKGKSFFYSLFHKERVSVAFYPFLFISTLLIVIIMNTIKII